MENTMVKLPSLPESAVAKQLKRIEQRLIRIETRLCQLMAHMNLDPYSNLTSEED